MYNPASFKQNDPEKLHALIRDYPFATLVSHGPQGLQASQLPFLLYPDEGPHGVLRAHLARANPHAAALAEADACLVIFQGEHGYVSPSWYPSKTTTHRTVPTWNYVTVHAHGKARLIDTPEALRRLLHDLTGAHEARRTAPWSIDDAPPDYIAAQMKAIVGFEIAIDRLEGKWKLSQNKEANDRQGVIAGLQSPEDPHAHPALALRMRETGK